MDIKSVYLAGPMRGITEYNYPEFDRVAGLLRSAGIEVFSPAENDRAMGVAEPITQDKLKAAILWDLACIARVDAIVLLDGWINSSGVRLELEMARFVGCQVRTETEMIVRIKHLISE